MKREDILRALEEVSDKHIKEAEKPPKKKKRIFLRGAVAAVLVLVIGIYALLQPMRISADAVVLASSSRVMPRPDFDDYKDRDKWRADLDAWNAEAGTRLSRAIAATKGLETFFKEGSQEFLTAQNGKNKLWSPVNAYIGLAMTAELAEGETKQQILDLFGVKDLETLRKQVSAVWESMYQNNSREICVLANSLWLEQGLRYEKDTMDALAYHYYASVYQGDLGSERINKDIATWVNKNTGNFLKNNTDAIALPEDTVMAIYSTLYFQAKWTNQFSKSNNTTDVFHSPDGDVQATFMNKKLTQMYYYWGEKYSAVNLSLKNGSSMWFILPDEGLTPEDVLNDGTYMDMVISGQWENNKYMKVNLSIPKFDVSSEANLADGLKNMGMTDAFSEYEADFSKLTSDSPVYLGGANQSVRVEIDEEGVKAAAYIEIPGAGSAQPPDEIIDFVLDRPFLFVITKANIPLFAGCVNQP